MRAITADKEKHIIHLLKEGHSVRQVASQVNVSAATVGRTAKRCLQERIMGKPGRPHILSDTDKRKIVRDISSGKSNTAVEVSAKLAQDHGMSVSPKTVSRALKESGFRAAPKVKKPLLSVRHHQAHLEFAHCYKDWMIADWRKVIWSDESKINRLSSDRRLWCWKQCGKSLSSQAIQPTLKHGGGSLMVWGCITSQGVGFLTKIEGRMNAELYCEILRDELMETLQFYNLTPGDIVFQQDNDPKHTSMLARKCLQELGLNLLQWPAQSPDLNPIEHIWDHLKQCLNTRPRKPKGMLELWERVEEEWESISQEVILKLIDSMPR